MDVTKPHLKQVITKSIESGVVGRMGEAIVKPENSLASAIARSIRRSEELRRDRSKRN